MDICANAWISLEQIKTPSIKTGLCCFYRVEVAGFEPVACPPKVVPSVNLLVVQTERNIIRLDHIV